MSPPISTIPNHKFVNCIDCRYRRKRRVLKKNGRGKETLHYCYLDENKPRRLYGQKGCDNGKRRNVEH